MIIKSFEAKKINLNSNPIILFYGKNEGFKKDVIKHLINSNDKIFNYDEKEILENSNYFLENISSKSLFEDKKIIIIKRVTDKILKVVNDEILDGLRDIVLILNAENLEKKSKLRSIFEKSKKYICSPFYPDNNITLSKLTYDFLNKRKISMSKSNINLIISTCNGDRENLINELKKIEFFAKNGKKLTDENIFKLTNLIENHSISELIDNCLAKNRKKTISILNENNYSNEDSIIILRSLLNKSKKIFTLSCEYEKNNNIEQTISLAKPPIFWKDKEITKQQIYKWTPKNISKLIYQINEVELSIKKNINNSIWLITDLIIEQSS